LSSVIGILHRKTRARTSGPDFTLRHLTLTLISASSLEHGGRVRTWPHNIAWQEDHPIKDRPANGTTVQDYDYEDAADCLWGET
ncbi:MAG: hypothetical protein WAU05_10830, partial [Nitrospira sp.]